MSIDLRVLVVDDELEVREVISALLEDKGLSVVTASSATEAVAELSSSSFDVVLLDVHMPGAGGGTVLDHIRRTPATDVLPVIVISASRDAEYELIDVFDYLSKPVDFDRLFSDLEYIAARKRVEGSLASSGGNFAEKRFTDSDYQAFVGVLKRRAGLAMPPRRRSELERAVWSRVRHLLKPGLDAYRRFVDSDEGEPELKKLVLLLTVGETYFFRNPGHFDVLRRKVLPALRERLGREGRRELRVLSAGSSTGEEAYSLAMVIREQFPSLSGWNIRVTGIDINNRSLAFARKGRYRGGSLRGLDDESRKKYFDERPGGMLQVKPYLRDLVDFRYFNLRKLAASEPPSWMREMDLVFCRNVLIYFDRETIEKVLEAFAYILAPGGALFLGHAESALQDSTDFDTVYEDNVFYFVRRPGKGGRHTGGGTAGLSADAGSISGERDRAICSEPDPAKAGRRGCRTAGGLAMGAVSAADADRPQSSSIGGETAAFQEHSEACPPCDLDYLFRRGLSLFDAEDFEAAGKVFDRMLKLDDGSSRALVGRGLIFANSGREREALGMVEEALRKEVGLSEGYFLRAMLLERMARFDQAFDDYQRAVLWDPPFVMARLNLGFAAERLGRRDLARQIFGEAYDLIRGATAYRPDRKLSGGMSLEALEALAKGKKE